MALAISVKSSGALGKLDNIFAKVAHVYFSKNAQESKPTTSVEVDFELPIIEDSVSFDTGGIDKTEIKLTTGTIWTSKATKGDSDITMQIASLNAGIADLFLSKQTDGGYALDVKKTTGSLFFVDETGKGLVILPKVEMYGSLVVGEGDNPAYFNATVTPLINNAGASIYVDAEEAEG